MVTFTVYKGSENGSIIKSTTLKPDELTGDQVLLRITASGLCGTDEHYRRQDMVLGHEGAGVVVAVGPAVRTMKPGDRVGWGWEHDSCGICELCLSGREPYCIDRIQFGDGNLDQGSFSTGAVWREAFLFKIPEGLTDEEAAPLMCGGATVFNALNMYNVDPTSRVGIIGVGGLGHLAIQFAAKMGCDVAVFSGTESKREEAMSLGAKTFYATKGKKELNIGEKKLDYLLVTTSFLPDWNIYLPLLYPTSTIFPLTVSQGDFSVPYMPLLLNGLRVQGTITAPRHIHRRMLEFAARNGVKPIIQRFPMTVEGIEEAMQKLNDGKMRYRGVLMPQ